MVFLLINQRSDMDFVTFVFLTLSQCRESAKKVFYDIILRFLTDLACQRFKSWWKPPFLTNFSNCSRYIGSHFDLCHTWSKWSQIVSNWSRNCLSELFWSHLTPVFHFEKTLPLMCATKSQMIRLILPNEIHLNNRWQHWITLFIITW